MLLGPTIDPRISSELSLRVPHLALRIREHSARALALAQGLERLGAQVGWVGGRQGGRARAGHPQAAAAATLSCRRRRRCCSWWPGPHHMVAGNESGGGRASFSWAGPRPPLRCCR
jgi:hypothetical protein